MNGHTFISYARDDQDFVLKLATKLKDSGIPIWLDQWDIPAGADWDQTIDKALEKSGQVLVVLSPASVASKQVRGEIQSAIAGDKLLVPVLYRECTVPQLLRLIQHVDLTSGQLDDHLVNQLVRVLRQPHQALRQPSGNDTRQDRRRIRSWIVSAVLVFALILGGSWFALNDISDTTDSSVTGSLKVNVNTERARVFIDGKNLGVAQHGKPLILNRIEIGQHLIRIVSEGHEQQRRRINIKENELTEIGFELHQRTR